MTAAVATKGPRYQALDAWRGIVCLVVVLEHAGVSLWSAVGGHGFSGAVQRAMIWSLTLNLGAPLFFVISGYCIASSLTSLGRKGVTPKRFLARRFWRIYPPYWASALIIALLVVALDRLGLNRLHEDRSGLELFAPGSLNLGQWIGNLTLTETWRPLLAKGDPPLLLNRVAWALCYQEQFYLICFLAVVIAPRRLFAALAVATAAIVTFRVVAWDSNRHFLFVGLFPDLWHEFAVGLALFWRINVAKSWYARRAVELAMIALFGVAYQFEVVSSMAASAFGLLLLVFYRWDDAIARVRQLDPLRWCGRRSYAIYLIHLPVCTVGSALLASTGMASFWPRALLMVPAVTAASVAAGWLFYRHVDRRFTDLPDFWIFAKPKAAGELVADPAPVVRAWPWQLVGESRLLRRVLVGVLALASFGVSGHSSARPIRPGPPKPVERRSQPAPPLRVLNS